MLERPIILKIVKLKDKLKELDRKDMIDIAEELANGMEASAQAIRGILHGADLKGIKIGRQALNKAMASTTVLSQIIMTYYSFHMDEAFKEELELYLKQVTDSYLEEEKEEENFEDMEF